MKKCAFRGCVLVFSLSVSLAGTYSGGSGTSGDPYQIANASDLATLSATSGDWNTGIYFIQTANITISGEWSPIGNSTTYFRGSYNGKGYTISGVTITNQYRNGDWGFFGYTNGATIQNLGLINISIAEKSEVGGIIGYAQSTTVTNCYTTGTVSTYYGTVGGLIGSVNASTVSNCYSTAVVSAGSSGSGPYSGGVIAKTDGIASNISNSYHTTGRVGGRDYVGGVMGALMHSSTLSGCYSTGLVEGTAQTGGLVGNNSATIHDCYSHAVANSGNASGGFVGNNTSDGTITNSYSTGNPGATTNEGGFAGQNSGTISNCFWDVTASGNETSAGGTGKTTAEMKTLSTFISAGWDFEGETANGTNNYWDLSGSINDGYPYLSWQDGEDVSLPVELTNFTAECQGGAVLLKWLTESETENLGFILEKSLLDTGNWLLVADYRTDKSLQGHGSTSAKHDYQFTDQAVQPGATYRYRLADVDYSGKMTWHKEVEVKVIAGAEIIPQKYSLKAAYPNPFNPKTTISYDLPEAGIVKISVYDLTGRVMAVLVDGQQQAGSYHYHWEPVNLATGVYFIQIQAGAYQQVRKCLLVK